MDILLQDFFYPELHRHNQDIFENIQTCLEKCKPHFYCGGGGGGSVVAKNHTRDNVRDNVRDKKRGHNEYMNKIKDTMAGAPVPEGCDSLFWAIYKEMCDTHSQTYTYFGLQPRMAEIQEKSRIIHWIQEDTKRFQKSCKEHKMTKARVQEILTKLLTNIHDNIDCIMAYSGYFNVRIYLYYPKNKTYCTFTPCTDDYTTIYIEYSNKQWKKRDEIINVDECIFIHHYLGEGGNALGAESLYKKEDLIQIAKKAGIDTIKITKKELFDKINIYCYCI